MGGAVAVKVVVSVWTPGLNYLCSLDPGYRDFNLLAVCRVKLAPGSFVVGRRVVDLAGSLIVGAVVLLSVS